MASKVPKKITYQIKDKESTCDKDLIKIEQN
jgi:hypothetical protein